MTPDFPPSPKSNVRSSLRLVALCGVVLAIGNGALLVWFPDQAASEIDGIVDTALGAFAQRSSAIIAAVSLGSLIMSIAMVLIERAFSRHLDQQLAAEQRIRFLAYHDPMTGLLNRVRFSDLFADALETGLEARDGYRGPDELALLLVDLDHFKSINDLYGHAAGDAVICMTADRLRTVAGKGDLVARIGGDEFVVAQLRATLGSAERLAAAIVASLAEPFVVGSRTFNLSASIGISIRAPGTEDATSLFSTADKALYKAKQRGRNGFVIFDDELSRTLQERRAIEDRLRALVHDPDGLGIVYQPLCGIEHGEVVGFEALMRLAPASDFSASADVFIPIAETLGIIAPLGAHMIHRALHFATSLPEPLTIAINVSPRQFFVADPALSIVEVTRRALADTGFPAHRVELEITEGLFLQSTKEVMTQLQDLKNLGVQLALDDFGSGYCSLGYLSRFPIDKLKIDKSFLADALERPRQLLPILKSIGSIGAALGLTIVAEGIETAEQAEIAERAGCQQLQGYYFCRPIEPIDVAAYVMCNQLGTQLLREDTCTGGRVAGCASFWSRLAWTQTSGRWSPLISKAS